MFGKEDINIGGSAFWILLILLSLMGLSYLMLWSFHNNSIRGAIISTIFAIMIISGVLLSRNKVFDMNSWSDNCLSATLGFVTWSGLGIFFGSQSILSVGTNHLFASIASELPVFTEMIMNNFIIPISEELFWMIGIPFALISIMNTMGKKWSLLKNDYFQMVVIVVVAGSTFAIFHVGKAFIAFMISAIIFRTILIVLVYGDYKFDMLKGINLVAGFGVGAHIANNILDTGFQKTWLILMTNVPVMLIVVSVFGLVFLSALNSIAMFLVGKYPNLMRGDDAL